MKLHIASMILLTACVAESDDSNPSCEGGKCDGDSAPRIITIGADRRPVDGPLVELHLELTDPPENLAWNVVREVTTFDRRQGREVTDREVLVEKGECSIRLDGMLCGKLDDAVEIGWVGDSYDAELVTPEETRNLGTGLALRRARFTSVNEYGARAQLAVEKSQDGEGYRATLRTTPPPAPAGGPQAEPGYRVLFSRGECAVTGEAGKLECVADERPVDGSFVELTVAPNASPRSDYLATIHANGVRLNGQKYDVTEQIDGFELE